MGSLGAMAQQPRLQRPLFSGLRGAVEKLVPEGIEGRVPYKGSVLAIMQSNAGRPARRDGLHRLPHIDEMRKPAAVRAHDQRRDAREPRVTT
jgi:IMP dehydrogenase